METAKYSHLIKLLTASLLAALLTSPSSNLHAENKGPISQPIIEKPIKLKNFDIPEKEDAVQADIFFKNKEYVKAFDLYWLLANVGDKYSQYMLSVIYLNGFGREANFERAYAWGFVAKEHGEKTYLDYFETLDKLKYPDENEQLKELSAVHLENFNDIAITKRFLRYFKDEFPRCSSSRVKGSLTSCSRVKVACNWDFGNGGIESFPDACEKFAWKTRPENIKGFKDDIDVLTAVVNGETMRSGNIEISEQNGSDKSNENLDNDEQ